MWQPSYLPRQDRRLFEAQTRKLSPSLQAELSRQDQQSPSRQELEQLRQRNHPSTKKLGKCDMLQQSLQKLRGSSRDNETINLDELRREIERLKKSLLDMSLDVEHWRSRCQQLERKTSSEDIERLRKMMLDNEEMLNTEIMRLRTDLDEWQRRYHHLERSFGEKQSATIREMESNMGHLKEDLDRMNVALQQKSEECLEYREKYLRVETQLREVMSDHKASMEDVQYLKLQQKEQKDEYDELIGKLESIIEILKAKFVSDLRELQTKQNIYFNQNNAIKLSLSQQKEAQHLISLIQQYSENAVTQANNQAKLKLVQDQKRNVSSQLATSKESLKQKQQRIEQLTQENQELQKKLERYKPRVYHLQKGVPEPVQPIPQQVITIQLQESTVAKLEGDLNTFQNKQKLATANIDQLTLVNHALENDYKRLQHQYGIMQQQLQAKDQSLADLQKQHKAEIERVYRELSTVQTKIVSEERVSELQQQLEVKEGLVKELQADLARRRELNQQFRSDKEDRDSTIDQLKKEVLGLQEEVALQKRAIKESQRREQSFKEMRERFEQQRLGEQKLVEENTQLQDKLKALKQDLQRKEMTLKDLRDKLDEHHQVKQTESVKKDLKAKVKRLKEELARKEHAIKHFKSKLDERTEELEHVKNDHMVKYSSAVQELEREQRKADQVRILQKKHENQVNQLVFLLRKLYRENVAQSRSNAKTSTSALSHYQQSRPNLSRFSESMNILNISPDDLQEFLEPRSEVKKPMGRDEDVDRFDEMLANLDTLDINKPFEALQAVINAQRN